MGIESLEEQFKEMYGFASDVIASAPGRLEVLGNHADYNAGLTLSCAVGFRCYVAMTKLKEPTAQLASTAFGAGPESFPIDQPTAPSGHWARYVLGLVDALKRRGHAAPGFAMLVDSQVPPSAGMSSSAALEMAALTGLVSLMGITLPTDELARIGQESESRAVGAQTGLLDQYTSLLGQRDQLLQIDFQSMQAQTIAAPPGWCFVAVDSGVKHDLTQEYNARRLSCESAAKAMGIESLRMATPGMLESNRSAMPKEDYDCAMHIIGENQRVSEAGDLLVSKDMAGFGKHFYMSHESSQSNFRNSCPELDELVSFAKNDDRCIGARLSGGGFGGISIHLVEQGKAEAYRTDLLNDLAPSSPAGRWSAVCEIGDGAAIDAT